MNAMLLQEIPISGSKPEFHFGKDFNYQLWVEFNDEKSNWYGCFAQRNRDGLSKVVVDKKNEAAFIVAGGQGYLINTSSKELLYQTEENPGIESLILTTNPDYFIAGTYNSIYVIDRRTLIKEIVPNFNVDGIYFTGQQHNIATGDLARYIYEEFNVAFKFDLLTFEITIDKEVKIRRLGPFEYVKLVDKK